LAVPLFRYFIVVGSLLTAGLYVLAGNLAPQPLPSYFGQTATLPANFYESPRELSARQTARLPVPADVTTVEAEAPPAPAVVTPPVVKRAARKSIRQHKPTPERVRTARGIGDMMVPISVE